MEPRWALLVQTDPARLFRATPRPIHPAGGTSLGSQPEGQQAVSEPNRENLTGRVNGWKHILNTLTIHYGDRIDAAGHR